MAPRLFLIDGHALIFKMYYAFYRRPMINSKGVDTSILFGFTKYILELIQRENPDALAVAFDPPGGTFRNEMFPEYKANRAETPQLVIDALEPLTELCRLLGMPVLMVKGFEADDVIGTVAKSSASKGYSVYMVTPDKDYGQLISDNIFQYKPGKNGGENEIVDKNAVCAKYGISNPLQVIDMLAICGDAADNVPGVKGVGEVGAGKLISKYGSVAEIYSHLAELSEKQAAMFEEARGHIDLSYELVTIKTDVPVDFDPKDAALDIKNSVELSSLFDRYEFNSLRKFIPKGEGVKTPEAPSVECKEIGFEELKEIVLRNGSFGFSVSGSNVTLACEGAVISSASIEDCRELLCSRSLVKYCFSIKPFLKDFPLEEPFRDIELIHYILDPEKSHDLDSILLQSLGVTSGRNSSESDSLFSDEAPEDSGNEAYMIYLSGKKLWENLASQGMEPLYNNIEGPLCRVLARMEKNGVAIDISSLKEFADILRSEIAEKESLVRGIAENPSFNVSSPKQVGELIFEKLRLDPKAKKGKRTSWPTDEATLTELIDTSPVIGYILEYRAAKKLLSTYIEPFPSYVSPSDGRVHTCFNQALTATGRLSSSNPNLQNIPVRTERGRLIRRAFSASAPGNVILSADYSQIELRVMAHLSGDEHMIQAFRSGEDVHSATASKIFGVPIEEVTGDQRRMAKTANFGIMYGISAFGLAQRLGVSRGEAGKLIDDYFSSFPMISSFIEKTLSSAREKGYVETVFGRRRYTPEIRNQNANIRAFAERNAVNAPIQGTAADIMKLAMIAVDREMRENGLKSRMVLQIHDELVFEVPSGEIDLMKRIVVENMEGVVEMAVPLIVECNYGNNWLEAH